MKHADVMWCSPGSGRLRGRVLRAQLGEASSCRVPAYTLLLTQRYVDACNAGELAGWLAASMKLNRPSPERAERSSRTIV